MAEIFLSARFGKLNDHLNLPTKWDSTSTQGRQLRYCIHHRSPRVGLTQRKNRTAKVPKVGCICIFRIVVELSVLRIRTKGELHVSGSERISVLRTRATPHREVMVPARQLPGARRADSAHLPTTPPARMRIDPNWMLAELRPRR
jgi:hypothetical protein